MESLQTTTKYTFEEYRKFLKAVTIQINGMAVKVVVIEVLCWLLAYLYLERALSVSMILIFTAILFPTFILFSFYQMAKSTYQSNKVAQNLEITFTFQEDAFSFQSKSDTGTIAYEDLFRILETKTNFYLMIARNQGYILVKENCSDSLIHFLQTLSSKKKA